MMKYIKNNYNLLQKNIVLNQKVRKKEKKNLQAKIKIIILVLKMRKEK